MIRAFREDPSICVIPLRHTGKYRNELDDSNTSSNAVTTLSLSQDGLTVVSGSKDGKLISWDVKSRQPLITFKKHSISADNEITNCVVDTINMTHYSAFHNNENVKTQQEQQKQVRNTSSLSIKPFKKFVENQVNLLQVNVVSDNWNSLYGHPDFDLKLDQNFSTPSTSLPLSIAHKPAHLIKYKPKSVSKGIQKKEASYAKKVVELQKKLIDIKQLYAEQKSINDSLREIIDEQQSAATTVVTKKKEEKTKTAAPASNSKQFFHRKFQ